MEVIHVPPPSKEAFHKGRPISDLIKSQVGHFKHLEEKLSPDERNSIPQHRITTENEAAVYIAAMTRLLRSRISVVPAHQNVVTISKKKSASPKSSEGLAIAASASHPARPRRKTRSKSSPKRK